MTTWFGFWFSRRFLFVALAVLELTVKTRLSLSSDVWSLSHHHDVWGRCWVGFGKLVRGRWLTDLDWVPPYIPTTLVYIVFCTFSTKLTNHWKISKKSAFSDRFFSFPVLMNPEWELTIMNINGGKETSLDWPQSVNSKQSGIHSWLPL